MAAAALTTVGLALTLAFLRNRFIGRPVARLATIMGELARGAHGVTIPDVNHHDEIGDMLRHFRTQRADITGDVSGLAA